MNRLTVLSDPRCPLCVRCRFWMEDQPAFVPLEFLACDSKVARGRYGELPWLGQELVVVGDGGEVWIGPAAFLVCLWALVDWREWSYRLAGPVLTPLAEGFFAFISGHRRALAAFLRHNACPDGHCPVDRARAGAYR